MKILEFELSGATAFFKVPSINSNSYYSFMSIHKIALLGILGAVCGFNGYNRQSNDQPEFYEKLNHLKCSIEIVDPKNIHQKIQVFNNSVGYASMENGNNLIVREQWLENPKWIIKILIDESNEITNNLVDKIINGKCTFMPYLGKNDHFANISKIKIIEGNIVEDKEKVDNMNGMFFSRLYMIKNLGYKSYLFNTELPIKLDDKFNNYIYESFSQTNEKLTYIDNQNTDEDYVILNINSSNYMFF